MSAPSWRLELSLIGPNGERYDIITTLDERTVYDELVGITPPSPFDFHPSRKAAMTACIKTIQRREFRKDKLEREARQLARLLGERMEDKEGWHGHRRQERLEDMGWGSNVRR